MTERLEEIKTRFNAMKELESFKKLAPTDLFFDDLNWLLQQAERVEESEEVLLELVKQNEELRKSIAFYSSESYNAHLERLLDRREQQNERYREALEFYANEDNW